MQLNFDSGIALRGKIIFLAACTAVLAGIIHIATILAIPVMARAWPALDSLHRLPPFATALLQPGNPSIALPRFFDNTAAMAICPFTLAQQPVRVSINLGDEPVFLSFHDHDGRVFYALNDRAAQRGKIDLVLMTRQQLDAALQASEEDEVPSDVRLLSPVPEGIIAVRVLSLQPGEQMAARARALQLKCEADASAGGS